jgi:hypothetical protein
VTAAVTGATLELVAHLLKQGIPAHELTREDSSKGGRAKAAKYAAEVKEKRRRRRRARYLAERSGRSGDWRATDALAAAPGGMPADPDNRLCPKCGGVREGLLRPQDRMCPGHRFDHFASDDSYAPPRRSYDH